MKKNVNIRLGKGVMKLKDNNIVENIVQNSTTERFVSLTDNNVEKFMEGEENESTQRKMQSDVAFLVKENKTRGLEDLRPPERTLR